MRLKKSKSRSQKRADIKIAFVILSLVYLTCIKMSTTIEALKVAMISATTVLNGPRSIVATQAVRKVQTIRMPQMRV